MAGRKNNDTTIGFGIAVSAAASGVAVSMAAWAFGAFAFWQALIGVAAALCIGFAVALPWRRDVAELFLRARSIGEDDVGPMPAARRTEMGAALARALIESRRRVNRMQAALEERSITGERVLDAAPEPLIVVDIRRMITHANKAAERAFGPDLTGRGLVEVLRSPELLDAVESVLSRASTEATVEIEVGDQVVRMFRAIVGPLDKIGGAGEAAVLAFQDLTGIRKLDAMRADFVANASHELRTPLASLVGFVETLAGPAENDPAARKRFLGIMRDQATRMTSLVEDLLSLSRVELDEHAPPGETDDPGAAILSVIEQLGPVAAARTVDVQFKRADDLPPVTGAPELLQQVFQNLIENAIKYGPEGGTVTVTAKPEGANLRISVADQGDGIPADHIPRLTERFYRVDVARSRQLGGTGLGLAIVKHILNRCDGGLQISSRVSDGSVFTVTLPITRTDSGGVNE